jgi:hypothetical protein
MLKVDISLMKTQDLTCDMDYIKQSNDVINDCLSKGFDVAEFADGTIIGTAVKIVEVRYVWNPASRRMMKVSSRRDFL